MHFISDILHFDGKFFRTIKDLFARPGFVPKQYINGKRVRYLDPIRMYLFTSAVFFIIFFYMKADQLGSINQPLSKNQRTVVTLDLEKELKNKPGDSTILRELALLKDTARPVYIRDLVTPNSQAGLTFDNTNFKSPEEYDSIQNTKPKAERDGWFTRRLTKKSIELQNRYKGNASEGANAIWNAFIHRLPYMLFISLPFFALILKLLYIRNKKFFYRDHAIFTLFHYILSFMLLLILFGFIGLQNLTGARIFDWLILGLIFTWLTYLLVEMKRFYQLGWGKTMFKFLLLNLLGLVAMLILFLFFLFFSIFQM
jgi:hypothetical protein